MARGRRVDLSELAGDPVLPEARAPHLAGPPTPVRLDQLAPNPLNTRDIHGNPQKITAIADSMRLHGQLQPCAAVTRQAFLKAFPEHETTIGAAAYVQVTGGRRYAAAPLAGLPTLDIAVKNEIAETRARFLAATTAENIDREDYDPIEEAHAVQLLVTEAGTGKAAALQLARTPAWVTQRLNLLKLAPRVQALVRTGEIPIREARTLHTIPADQQLAAWRTRKAELDRLAAGPSEGPEPGEGLTAVNRTPDPAGTGRGDPEDRRAASIARAVRRLGGTPDKIAESLRSQLTPEDCRTVASLLLDSQ